jgi:hypothetical protein
VDVLVLGQNDGMVRAQDIVRADGEVVHRKPVEGDMRWDGRVWRRWTGRRWSTAAYSVDPGQLRSRERPDSGPAVPDEIARRALARAVEDQVTAHGATVLFENEGRVVLGYRRPVPHLLLAVVTVLTAGLGAILWVLAAIVPRQDRVQLTVDDWGHVWPKRVASP